MNLCHNTGRIIDLPTPTLLSVTPHQHPAARLRRIHPYSHTHTSNPVHYYLTNHYNYGTESEPQIREDA